MEASTLCIIWFVLEGVLLSGYAILDGFDLGVGTVHLFVARDDGERRVLLNAIGPVWDGNEVWLVTFGGALFAAFPEAYASAFSGFYTALMLLLFALIMRAVSIEFRSKVESPGWRLFWDRSFSIASALAALLFGVAVGNAVQGIALDAQGNFTQGLFSQLGPYPLLVGIMTVSLFAMHGVLYLLLKTEGALRERLEDWAWHTWDVFLLLYVAVTLYTLALVPQATANYHRMHWTVIVPIACAASIAGIAWALSRERAKAAFLCSCGVVLTLVLLFGLALYPNLLPASNDPELSLTIFNAASSPKTLGIMLVIALVGMPLVLAYTALVYRTFAGPVRLDEESY